MRALLSVYDKTGIVEFAKALHDLQVDLVSSGGTAKAIAEAGIPVTDVAELTGVPAILGHRVVTLHPKVHGGLLADTADESHLADMDEYGIEAIDLVVSNLYPFSSNPSIELIDIGGPAMIRAAAKNHAHVGVVTDAGQHELVLSELSAHGSLSDDTRRALARPAFRTTAAYDAQIVAWLAAGTSSVEVDEPAELPVSIDLSLERRSGCCVTARTPTRLAPATRPQATAAGGTTALQHGGEDMSYLNVFDADAAWRLAHSLGDGPAAVVIKHANPCGVAVADDITAAYQRAHECDPVSAFGGIVAVNRPVTDEMAEALGPASPRCSSRLPSTTTRSSACWRSETCGCSRPSHPALCRSAFAPSTVASSCRRPMWSVSTARRGRWSPRRCPPSSSGPTSSSPGGWSRKVTSNAIVLVNDGQAVGIGCGQQNRRDAGRLACEKADGRARGGAYASDAFFPFPDGLDGAVEAGAACVIQPGGSIRDEEVIAAADEHGLAMVFTGERHFRH